VYVAKLRVSLRSCNNGTVRGATVYSPDKTGRLFFGSSNQRHTHCNFIAMPTWRRNWSDNLTPRQGASCLLTPCGVTRSNFLKTLRQIGIFVIHVSVCVWLWNISQDWWGILKMIVKQAISVSTSRESAQWILFCLLNCCTVYYPKYSNTHCFRSAVFTLLPAQMGTCQSPTCRYNN